MDNKGKLKIFKTARYVLYALYIIAVSLIGIIAAICMNRIGYEYSPIICYLAGIPLIAMLVIVITTIFGDIKPESNFVKSEIVRLSTVLILALILKVLGREANILAVLSVVFFIASAVVYVIGSSIKIILNKSITDIIVVRVLSMCLMVNSLVLATSAAQMAVLSKPVSFAFITITVLIAVHLLSLVVMVKNRYRYFIICALSVTLSVSSFCLTENYMSDREVLRDLYANGYKTILDLGKYESVKGNLYTVYKEADTSIEHLIDDNISYANLGKISDDYTYSIYQSDSEYIEFNWDTMQIVERISKEDIMAYANKVISSVTTLEPMGFIEQDGTINVPLQGDDMVSLYIAPTESGIELRFTAKDMTKFGVTQQPQR